MENPTARDKFLVIVASTVWSWAIVLGVGFSIYQFIVGGL